MTLVDDLNNKFQEKNDGIKQNRILKGISHMMMNSTYFLAWIHLLGDMILKMKKFFIQWRKFE